MSKHLRRPLTVAAGIAALALAGSTSAFAASASTVSVGGSTTAGSHPYAANAGTINFTAGAAMTCTSVSASGNINSGTVPWAPPNVGGLATIASSTWNGCTGAGFNLAVTQNGTWNVDITGATDASGNTPVDVSNISATVKDKATGGALCSFTVSGDAPGSVSNSAQTLTINASNLGVSPSPACGGLVHGPASFTGVFAITNPATGLAWPVIIS